MTVSQFNETFSSLKSENKVVVKTSIKSPSTFADKFRNMFRVTAVDINDLSTSPPRLPIPRLRAHVCRQGRWHSAQLSLPLPGCLHRYALSPGLIA